MNWFEWWQTQFFVMENRVINSLAKSIRAMPKKDCYMALCWQGFLLCILRTHVRSYGWQIWSLLALIFAGSSPSWLIHLHVWLPSSMLFQQAIISHSYTIRFSFVCIINRPWLAWLCIFNERRSLALCFELGIHLIHLRRTFTCTPISHI